MRVPAILMSLLAVILLLLVFAFMSGPSDDRWQVEQGQRETEIAQIEELGPVRQIAPGQFAAPFAENAMRLERIAPRQPLTPPKETGPKRTLLHRPVVTAAGLVTYTSGQLRLADIEVLDPQAVCIDIAGFAWPCGIIARTAFRNFLRGRAMSCIVPDGRWTETVVSQCLVGTQDPAAWLVSRGWVRALPGTEYAALEESAREGAKGVYGSDPRNLSSVADSGVTIQQSDDVTTPETPTAPLE